MKVYANYRMTLQTTSKNLVGWICSGSARLSRVCLARSFSTSVRLSFRHSCRQLSGIGVNNSKMKGFFLPANKSRCKLFKLKLSKINASVENEISHFGFSTVTCKRHCANIIEEHTNEHKYLYTTSSLVKEIMCKDMTVTFDFVSEEEEEMLHKEVEPHLKRLRYEDAHWDDVKFLL